MKRAIKRIFCAVVVALMLVNLASCQSVVQCNSLEDYANKISRSNIGYSDVEIDRPDHFLPSQTFIADYPYINGAYHFYEKWEYAFDGSGFAKSLLILTYASDIYDEAKAFMLESIPAYNNTTYNYDRYVFYENANFVKIHGDRRFPGWFTMACYNDTKQELVFIGLYGAVDQKYKDDPQGNWVSFIDTYYGEYYDFSE